MIEEMIRMSENIKNKIKNNESLDKYEMTIMFLYAIKNKPEVWYMTSKIDL
ncbi:hypothetical protein J5751_03535 [bacterium]|nr:hypothetical protein [bacterium]